MHDAFVVEEWCLCKHFNMGEKSTAGSNMVSLFGQEQVNPSLCCFADIPHLSLWEGREEGELATHIRHFCRWRGTGLFLRIPDPTHTPPSFFFIYPKTTFMPPFIYPLI